MNVTKMLNQRIDDVFNIVNEPEAKLSLDRQLTIGLENAFSSLASYNSVFLSDFKNKFSNRHSMMKLIATLYSLREHQQFRDMLQIRTYPSLNTIEEIWAQFAIDISTTPPSLQLFLSGIIQGYPVTINIPTLYTSEIFNLFVLDTIINSDGSSVKSFNDYYNKRFKHFFRPDGTKERSIYYNSNETKTREYVFNSTGRLVWELNYDVNGHQ